MIEKRNSYYKVNIGGLSVYVAVVEPVENLTGAMVAEIPKSMEPDCPHIVVAGIPNVRLDACAIAVSYLHALEHKIRSGRVRNLSLRFIMEYMSLRQIREAISVTQKGVSHIILASLSLQCLLKALNQALNLGGLGELNSECDSNILSGIVENSVRGGVRFD